MANSKLVRFAVGGEDALSRKHAFNMRVTDQELEFLEQLRRKVECFANHSNHLIQLELIPEGPTA